ncbi:MAG TPA: lipopolysaccharide heptosyltransferase II [Roseateles sp.]|nr:lipopolysaccharide heptosyltransferase II [Roseateles sp.]HWT53907.1 lipopolysaccharide heptosyltransferase II [Rhodocyclaceae bacterium]
MSYRILVVAPSWIGDTIMAQPLFQRLTRQHANVVIDALAPPWVAPLLERMPEINRVIDSPFRHGGLDWPTRRRIGEQLRSEFYDQAIVLPNSWKSALVPFYAKIKKRTGYRGEGRYFLLNDVHKLDKLKHPELVQRYAALAGPLDGSKLEAQLQSSREQQVAALNAHGLALDAAPVIFCPGAEFGPAKRWPAEYYAELAQRYGTPAAPVLLLGSPKDAPVGDEIVALSKGAARNLAGKTSLFEAIDLLAAARLVVSNDSGLMHVAAALQRPQVALYGSSSPAYTPPMNDRAKIVSLGVECSPCFERVCPLGHFKCMRDMKPEIVAAAAEQVT